MATAVDHLTERPLTLGDAAQIVEINAEMELAEPADEHLSVDDIVEELAGPTTDLPRASCGLFDGHRLVAYSTVSAISDETGWKAMLNGGVSSAWTRRGLGTRVLRRAQEQAKAWKAAAAPTVPGELLMWLEQHRVSTVALAQAEGFQIWRYFFRMQRDLADPVDTPAAPTGFAIRGYLDGDQEVVRVARNLSFADHWGSLESTPERWHAHMTGSKSFRPQHSYLAIFDDGPDAGSVAAFVMAEEFDAETDAHGYRTGYIALVGTLRAARGHGLASMLLRRQLTSMRDDGYAYAELGVDSDSPTGAGRLYQRAGFFELERNSVAGKRFGPDPIGG
ncbi:MAG: GNAT family N-acetyltransferase [Actinomycetota bacterium]|nr:GNAT family N-acetyltransferase [Actinomycetota bacterium]